LTKKEKKNLGQGGTTSRRTIFLRIMNQKRVLMGQTEILRVNTSGRGPGASSAERITRIIKSSATERGGAGGRFQLRLEVGRKRSENYKNAHERQKSFKNPKRHLRKSQSKGGETAGKKSPPPKLKKTTNGGINKKRGGGHKEKRGKRPYFRIEKHSR